MYITVDILLFYLGTKKIVLANAFRENCLNTADLCDDPENPIC